MSTISRCKLVCTEVKPSVSTDGQTKYGEQVTFEARYNNEDMPEDNSYSLYTPSATFTKFVSNPALYGKYEVGKAYYFDSSACE